MTAAPIIHARHTACWAQGSLHYATLTGLAPNTKYYYRYGDLISQLFSPEYSFTTPPVPGAGTTVKFLAWADAGQAVADGTNEYDYYDVSTRAAPVTQADRVARVTPQEALCVRSCISVGRAKRHSSTLGSGIPLADASACLFVQALSVKSQELSLSHCAMLFVCHAGL